MGYRDSDNASKLYRQVSTSSCSCLPSNYLKGVISYPPQQECGWSHFFVVLVGQGRSSHLQCLQLPEVFQCSEHYLFTAGDGTRDILSHLLAIVRVWNRDLVGWGGGSFLQGWGSWVRINHWQFYHKFWRSFHVPSSYKEIQIFRSKESPIPLISESWKNILVRILEKFKLVNK